MQPCRCLATGSAHASGLCIPPSKTRRGMSRLARGIAARPASKGRSEGQGGAGAARGGGHCVRLYHRATAKLAGERGRPAMQLDPPPDAGKVEGEEKTRRSEIRNVAKGDG